MMRFITLFFLFIVSLSNCWIDRESDCVEDDYAVDLLSGPSIFLGGACRVYLTNEYGGQRDEQAPLRYPLFLDWENGCSETYTVNSICEHALHFPSGPFIYYYSGSSVFGLPSGYELRSMTIFPESGYQQINVPALAVTVEGVPAFDSLVFLPQLNLQYNYSNTNQRLNIEADLLSVRESQRYVYVGLRLAGETDFRATIIDLLHPPSDLPFSSFADRLRWHLIQFGESGTDRITVSRVLDTENELEQTLYNEHFYQNQAALLLPEGGATYIYRLSGKVQEPEPFSWVLSEVATAIPEMIDSPSATFKNARKDGNFLRAEVTQQGILQFVTKPPDFPIPFNLSFWSLEGPASPGDFRTRIPAVGKDFATYYPDNPLENLWQTDLRVRHTVYPTIDDAADFWRLNDLPWLDRQRYRTYSIILDGE